MEEYNVYVGLDVHKDTVAVAYAGRERVEPRGIIPNRKRSLMKLVLVDEYPIRSCRAGGKK